MTMTLVILILMALGTTTSVWAIRHEYAERPVASIRAHEFDPPEPSRPW